jgi:methylmalonyl-CoA mutase N-terminal domain/subunit
VDPLGGSYYIESLTNEMESKIKEILDGLEKRGGIVEQIESGQIQRELAYQNYLMQKKVDSGEKVLVGVNRFRVEEGERDLEIYKMDPAVRDRQIAGLRKIKKSRDSGRVVKELEKLKRAARGNENIIPYLFEPLQAQATLGEIVSTLKEIYGEYKEPRTV